jgi:hypothetical protein
MEKIELNVRMPILYKIGDKVSTFFYEKFDTKYESRELIATITDISVHYSLMKSEIAVVYTVQATYEDRIFTTNVNASEVKPYNE